MWFKNYFLGRKVSKAESLFSKLCSNYGLEVKSADFGDLPLSLAVTSSWPDKTGNDLLEEVNAIKSFAERASVKYNLDSLCSRLYSKDSRRIVYIGFKASSQKRKDPISIKVTLDNRILYNS